MPAWRGTRVLAATACALALLAVHDPAVGSYAAVPGANGKLALVSTRDGNAEIYAMNANGTGQTNLTRHPSSDYSPAWSPDGRRIAFASVRDGTWRIYLMNADGSDPRPLTPGPWDRDPAWSPDGSQVLFHRSLDTGSFVYVVPASGGDQRPLARSNIEIRASWSPDGSRIAFTSALDRPWRIVTMNPDGGDPRTVPTEGEAFAPSWSPDGGRLAFASRKHGNSDIFTVGREGGVETRVTSSAEDELRPSWSPDGRRIAFVTLGGVVKVVATDGSGEITVATAATSFLGTPDWQPATDLVARASGPARATVGRRVTYTVAVANSSARAADDVRVQLSVPAWATLVNRRTSRGSCTRAPATVCSFGALPPQATARVTIVVVPRRAGALVLRAAARSTTPEATAATNAASLRTTVRRP